jgi:hypothetical protein
MMAAAVALACAGISVQAGASVKFIGSTLTDSVGDATVPFHLDDICYRCKVAITTDAPATTGTLFQYTFHFTPAHPANFTPFNQQFGLYGWPSADAAIPTYVHRVQQGAAMSQTPAGQRAYVSVLSMDSTSALFHAAPETKLNYSITVSPAPEPTTWALMIAGFAGIGAALRRRRQVVALAV